MGCEGTLGGSVRFGQATPGFGLGHDHGVTSAQCKVCLRFSFSAHSQINKFLKKRQHGMCLWTFVYMHMHPGGHDVSFQAALVSKLTLSHSRYNASLVIKSVHRARSWISSHPCHIHIYAHRHQMSLAFTWSFSCRPFSDSTMQLPTLREEVL